MQFLLFAFALLVPSLSDAAPSCWQACMSRGRPTSTCAEACGIRSRAEAQTCFHYCSRRGGRHQTCESLCPLVQDDGDGISEEDRRANDDAMDRNICESSGRCRDRGPNEPVPQDENDRAMERNRCLSGGDCVNP